MKPIWSRVLGLSALSGEVFANSSDLEQLMQLSLEELSMVQVETASKFSQQLSDVPASIYVIDNERIIRSGVRTIAEALALAPGLTVTKFTESEFIVSSRGFHNGLHNKMLVMIDGRSLFSPAYGGVYWSDIDYVLEDIERIEVLRGPGGAIWGGNAVNAVINIITKDNVDTQGTLLSGTYARGDNYNVSVRQGLQFNEHVTGRAFYKHRRSRAIPGKDDFITDQHTAGVKLQGERSNSDSWQLHFGGTQRGYDQDITTFHWGTGEVETRYAEIEAYTSYLQLDYATRMNERLEAKYKLWAQTNSDQALDAPGDYHTVDFDAAFHYQYNDQHDITFGGGYRAVQVEFDYLVSDFDTNVIPEYLRLSTVAKDRGSIVNAYVQSQYQWNAKLTSVVGLKAEYFQHTNSFELSPRVSAIYSFDQKHSLWAGVGRAVVTPSYMDSYTAVINMYGPDDIYLFLPNDKIGNEDVWTGELGYRFLSEQFELDSTLFVSRYGKVRGFDWVGECVDKVSCLQMVDNYSSDSKGIEVAITYPISDSVSMYGAYTYLSLKSKTNQGETDLYTNIDAQHLGNIQLLWNINSQWQLDTMMRAQSMDHVKGKDYSWEIPNYIAFDMRLAWKKHEQAPMVEFVAQNIGKDEGYKSSDFQFYEHFNEELFYVRVSHEF